MRKFLKEADTKENYKLSEKMPKILMKGEEKK
jgi:hypothetical protein